MMVKSSIFTTLGCRMNAYETEAMKVLSAEAGLGDAMIVNTCAVTAEAVRKARQTVRKLHRAKPDVTLIVTGCAAQTEPETFAAMDEVDHVIGNEEKMRLETWRTLAHVGSTGKAEKIQVDDIMSVTEALSPPTDGFGARARAYIQVQTGCDHRCTFCIIPYGRGNSRSVNADIVIDRIKRLVDKGFNEVVLTGVDLTSWGADLPDRPRLGDLVMQILKRVPDLPRLRISSIDSIEVDENLMQAIATERRLMPHLHLSLQHGDDLILKRMKRRHLRDNAISFTEKALGLRPDLIFGADLIVGFPTETEANFENSLKLVEECRLTWLHVFPYSSRPGTPSARLPQVHGSHIRNRAARLRAAGTVRVDRYLRDQVGTTQRVLMENAYTGRTGQFAQVDFPEAQPKGRIVAARITGVADRRLTGYPLSDGDMAV